MTKVGGLEAYVERSVERARKRDLTYPIADAPTFLCPKIWMVPRTISRRWGGPISDLTYR